MKSKVIKVLVLVFAFCMLFAVTSCKMTTTGIQTGDKGDDATDRSATEQKKDPVTIVSLHEEGTVPAENASIIAEVRKRTGINWSPILVGPGESMTKLNAMIASNSLPDIFSFSQSNGELYVQNGILLELDELLKTYGKDILENRKDYFGRGLNAGGITWGIPSPPGYPTSLAIRTDWLKNLNMDMPNDLDSFYNVMKAFTYNDPNKNGKNDTIGLASCIKYDSMYTNIFGAFGIPYGRPIMVDGVVTTYMKHPNYLKAIEYWRKLYNEGLMEPDFATIPNMACLEKLWNGTYGAIDFPATGTTNNWLGRYTEEVKPTFDFAIIKGEDGIGGMVQPFSTSYKGIAKSCKNPEEAMKLMNYLTTKEGDELLYLGIEGVHFKWIDKANGKFEYLPPYDVPATHRSDGGFIFWPLFYRYNDNTEIMTLNSTTRKAFDLCSKNFLKDAFIFGVPAIAKELGTTLSDIEKEALANLIVTTGDVEAEYKKYISRWMAEGGKIWEQQATEIYKKENPD
ncbi:MAG: extracellular solute-binding protein [Firmicutes bacterium]|nr:extracellular solute-binding protein [Bacillota bacterium]